MVPERTSTNGPDGSPGPATTAPAGAPDIGLWCCSFELSGSDGPTAEVAPTPGQRRARALVRLHGEPLGYLTLALDGPTPAGGPTSAHGSAAADPPPGDRPVDVGRIVSLSWSEFGPAITAHLQQEQLTAEPGTRPAPPADGCPNQMLSTELVSVIVCTRNRAAMLATCLDALAGLTHPALEILVVDNAPTDDSTRRLVEARAALDPRFRYVLEVRPGLSAARNRGLGEARGARIAYTDDDVRVDAGWVGGLLRGFARRADVGCVTGLVCAAGVTTAAEAYFDARASSWSTRCEPELFDMSASQRTRRGPLYPYSAGIFGTGANFAFDRRLVAGLGGFDEALGAGTATRGGEDLDMFIRVLLAGSAIAYEPAAVVWHHHRADDASLLAQMFGYGTGMTALMSKLVTQPATRAAILRRVPGGVARMTRISSATQARMDVSVQRPKGAGIRELAGMIAGPVLYARARRAAHPAPGRS